MRFSLALPSRLLSFGALAACLTVVAVFGGSIRNGYPVDDEQRNRSGIVKLDIWNIDPRRAIDLELEKYTRTHTSTTGVPLASCYNQAAWSRCTGAPTNFANRGAEYCETKPFGFCTSNRECQDQLRSSGYSCVSSRCVSTSDSRGQICSNVNGSACWGGTICLGGGALGQFPRCSDCSSNSQCPANYICDGSPKRCVPNPSVPRTTGDPFCESRFLTQCWNDLRASENYACAAAAVDDTIHEGSCTGTIISSSVASGQTWILTAAHCFYILVGPTRQIEGRMREPRAQVTYNSSGTSTTLTSSVFVHPSWQASPNWFDTPDVALVRISQALPVVDGSGARILEYRRPVYVGDRAYLENSGDGAPHSAVCGFAGTNNLRCGEARDLGSTNRYVSIAQSDWIGGARFEGGDSGGPLFILNDMIHQYVPGSAPNGRDPFPADGIVAGVISGPAVLESWDWSLPCPCDYYSTGTFGLASWFEATVGPGVLRLVGPPILAVGRSSGASFRMEGWAEWWTGRVRFLGGDFNNDGRDDVMKFDIPAGDAYQDGGLWVGLSDGTKFNTTQWATWSLRSLVSVLPGDFDGDGRSDVMKFDIPAGSAYAVRGLWVGLSDGVRFNTTEWARWSLRPLVKVLSGDFNGDGKTDVMKFDIPDGNDYATRGLWVGLSSGSRFNTTEWARWSLRPLVKVLAGDFNGDGMTDVMKFDVPTGSEYAVRGLWVGLSDGTKFNTTEWARWSLRSLVKVLAGDFNGDGKTDVMKFDIPTGSNYASRGLWVGLSDGTKFNTTEWARWDLRQHIMVLAGDFNGDGKTDVMKFDAAVGDDYAKRGVWVGISDGTKFITSQWARIGQNSRMIVQGGDYDGDSLHDILRVYVR